LTGSSAPCSDGKDVAVPDNVCLPFKAPEAGLFAARKAVVLDKRVISDSFCTDELVIEIAVDRAGSVLGAHAFLYRPCAALIFPNGKKGDKPERPGGKLNDPAPDRLGNGVLRHEAGNVRPV